MHRQANISTVMPESLRGRLKIIRSERFSALEARTTSVKSRIFRHALTPREQQVLEHIVMGETNPRIAVALSLSVKTVEWHRTNLMKKLAVHTVADLVRYALRHGLVEDDE